MITTTADSISVHVVFKINKNLILTATIPRDKFYIIYKVHSISYKEEPKYLSKNFSTTKQYLD